MTTTQHTRENTELYKKDKDEPRIQRYIYPDSQPRERAELSCQPHTTAPTGQKAWVGPRAGTDVLENKTAPASVGTRTADSQVHSLVIRLRSLYTYLIYIIYKHHRRVNFQNSTQILLQ